MKRLRSSFSMQGFDLHLRNGVIELRAQGERMAGDERAPAAAFTSIAAKLDSRLILYDVRDANYRLSELEWDERLRFVARLFSGYRTAYIIRADQKTAASRACKAHARNGDKAKAFSSKGTARDWLVR